MEVRHRGPSPLESPCRPGHHDTSPMDGLCRLLVVCIASAAARVIPFSPVSPIGRDWDRDRAVDARHETSVVTADALRDGTPHEAAVCELTVHAAGCRLVGVGVAEPGRGGLAEFGRCWPAEAGRAMDVVVCAGSGAEFGRAGFAEPGRGLYSCRESS
jgi:hypothetical protein